jgi:hypothetical protein
LRELEQQLRDSISLRRTKHRNRRKVTATQCQAEIGQRLAASQAAQSASIVQSLVDADLADGETVAELAEHIRDLIAQRLGLRAFLGEQGRSLAARGDPHGTQILRMLEQIGAVRPPLMDLDPQKIDRAAAEIASKFARRKAGL